MQHVQTHSRNQKQIQKKIEKLRQKYIALQSPRKGHNSQESLLATDNKDF